MAENKYTYNFIKEVHQKQERSFVTPIFVPDFKGKTSEKILSDKSNHFQMITKKRIWERFL